MKTFLITERNRAAGGIRIKAKDRFEATKQARAYGFKKPSIICID